MTFLRLCVFVLMAATLSACGGKSVWAPDAEVEKRRYTSNERPYLMLKTMVHNRTGSGGHAALTINASQVVMYDPAGRWTHPLAAERNDVVFGMFPKLEENYDQWHARESHHVVNQKIYVTPEVAEMAYQLALASGPSLDGHCTVNISKLLRQLPGFEGLDQTYFPVRLMKDFATLPNVKTIKVFDDGKGISKNESQKTEESS